MKSNRLRLTPGGQPQLAAFWHPLSGDSSIFRWGVAILATAALFGPFSAGAASPGTVCEAKQVRDLLAPDRVQSLDQFATLRGEARLVLIGEIHYTFQSFREELLNKVTAGMAGRICQFYELDQQYDIERSLKNFEQVGFEDVHAQFLKLHRLAQKKGWREFTVDVKGVDDDTSVEEINRRDREMAKQILRHMAKNCDSAVMFVGKAHVQKEARDRVILPHLLRAQNLKLMTVNLQDASDDRMALLWGPEDAAVSQSWNGVCRKGQSLPRPFTAQVFASGQLPSDLRFFAKTQEKGLWNSFDWTVLKVDVDFKTEE